MFKLKPDQPYNLMATQAWLSEWKDNSFKAFTNHKLSHQGLRILILAPTHQKLYTLDLSSSKVMAQQVGPYMYRVQARADMIYHIHTYTLVGLPSFSILLACFCLIFSSAFASLP